MWIYTVWAYICMYMQWVWEYIYYCFLFVVTMLWSLLSRKCVMHMNQWIADKCSKCIHIHIHVGLQCVYVFTQTLMCYTYIYSQELKRSKLTHLASSQLFGYAWQCVHTVSVSDWNKPKRSRHATYASSKWMCKYVHIYTYMCVCVCICLID